jgi:hypothetical protein
MPININLKKGKVTKANSLPTRIIEEIAERLSNEPTIALRLFRLPIIAKGKQHNSFPRTNVNQYVTNKSIELDIATYIGYFVYFHTQTQRWTLHEHVFNVDKSGKVQEHSKGMDWSNTCYYLGLEVPKTDYKDEKFASRFSDMEYINKHSSRALFEVPVINKKKTDS